MDRPLVLISPGRSGSSLVAGLLARHGVWCGVCRPGDAHNPTGYYENAALKSKMLALFGRDWLGSPPVQDPQWPGIVRSTISAQGYEKGPWLFKTGAFYWKTFAPMDPVYVKVWRDINDILASYERCGFLTSLYTQEEIETIVENQLGAMAEIPGPDVNVETLLRFDTADLANVLKTVDIDIDRDIVLNMIDPEVWH